MIKTFLAAFVCAVSVVFVAQAQTSGSAGGGVFVGAGTCGGCVGAGTAGAITGGGSVVTPPASVGVGVSGGVGGGASTSNRRSP